MKYTLNGAPLNINVENVIGTIWYPPGFFYDPASRKALGIVDVPGDAPAEPAPAPVVPVAVAMWQARAVLIEDGLLVQVNAYIAAIPDPTQRAIAQAKFEYSSTVRRDDPLAIQILPKLGKTDAEIDAMFIRAAAKV